MVISPEARKKYFAEISLALRREGLGIERIAEDRLAVSWEGQLLCEASGVGAITYRKLSVPEREAAKDKVYDTVRIVAEYMSLMEEAPLLEADGLDEPYKLLADFNGTVLAGHETKYGVQFVTWDWNYNRTGVVQDHYTSHDYEAAKQDFAIRAGLVERHRIFNDQQLAEVYRSIHETLESEYPITAEREKLLKEAAEQIEYAVPDLESRVLESNQKELEAAEQEPYMNMTQQF